MLRSFTPSYGNGGIQAVGTTAAAITLPGCEGIDAYTVSNVGTQVVFIRATPASSTISAIVNADFALLPNSQVTLGKGREDTRFSVIAPAVGSTVYIIGGIGI